MFLSGKSCIYSILFIRNITEPNLFVIILKSLGIFEEPLKTQHVSLVVKRYSFEKSFANQLIIVIILLLLGTLVLTFLASLYQPEWTLINETAIVLVDFHWPKYHLGGHLECAIQFMMTDVEFLNWSIVLGLKKLLYSFNACPNARNCR